MGHKRVAGWRGHGRWWSLPFSDISWGTKWLKAATYTRSHNRKRCYGYLRRYLQRFQKKMKISKRVYDQSGGSRQEEKVLQINVKPGWKAGTKVTFAKEGDRIPGKTPADIAFIIRDKPHATFKREDSNIVYTHRLSLRESLCGSVVTVPLLSGQKRNINCMDEVIKPNTTKRIQGEGLPFPKEPHRKGDLIVKFDIQFHDRISQSSKDVLTDVLGRY